MAFRLKPGVLFNIPPSLHIYCIDILFSLAIVEKWACGAIHNPEADSIAFPVLYGALQSGGFLPSTKLLHSCSARKSQ
jgi:hypothetical protein